MLLSLTVTTKYDGIHNCPPRSFDFCSGNSRRAVLPLNTLIASDILVCGLQETDRRMWSGMTSVAGILNCVHPPEMRAWS